MSGSPRKIIEELNTMYRQASGIRFPYEDVRLLLRVARGSYENLIPDLDTYFSCIAGYCSWGARILTWPPEKTREAQEKLSMSFFEKHPQYSRLRDGITQSKTPDLFAQMALNERMRMSLLELFKSL